jgi:hypothetical protein
MEPGHDFVQAAQSQVDLADSGVSVEQAQALFDEPLN